jgi:hypothetical protein
MAHTSGVELNLDDFTRIGAKVPVLADLKPSGKYLMSELIAIGGIQPLNGKLRLQGELLTSWFLTERSTWNTPTNLHQARLLVGWQALSWLAVVGGPTVNVFTAEGGDRATDFAPVGSWRLSSEQSDLDVSIWPGLSLGVELL